MNVCAVDDCTCAFSARTVLKNGCRSIDSQIYWVLYSKEVLWSAASVTHINQDDLLIIQS